MRRRRRGGVGVRHLFVESLGLLALAAGGVGVSWAQSPVVINEIQYNPPAALGEDEDYEFVELFNVSHDLTVDLSGWVLKDSSEEHRFVIPAGTALAPLAFLVLARNPGAMLGVGAESLELSGPVAFPLGNDRDAVRLFDAAGNLIDRVEYRDAFPWPEAADGMGSTLERIDPEALRQDDFVNFAASAPGTKAGTPGAENTRRGKLDARASVVINEIQYNPVRDPAEETLRHCSTEEFIELLNRGDQSLDLSGWTLAGGIDYVLPPGTVLERGGHLAVYRDRDAFQAKYGDVPGAVGPYERRLDDGGEDIILLDAAGRPADYVDYDDSDPWPVNPDGVRGSLELADPFSDNDRGRSWFESEDFRGTPGARNSATRKFDDAGGNSGPQITLARAIARTGDGLQIESERSITSGDPVVVSARVLDEDGVAAVRVEYQVVLPADYIRRSDPRYLDDWTTVEMELDLSVHRFFALLPLQPHRSVVRYRLVASDTRGQSSVAPRAADPEPNHAYFVYDGVPAYVANVESAYGDAGFVHANLTQVPVYHLIAHPDDVEEAQYDVRRPWTDNTYYWTGTFVFEDEVHDHVPFRIRGKQRFDRPKRHWKIKFNKGHRFRGRYNDGTPYPRRRVNINLNSTQHLTNPEEANGEGGVIEGLGFRLFRDVGVMAPHTTAVHFRVIDSPEEHDQYDGDFFGLFLDIQRIDNVMVAEFDRPSEDAGIYKMEGGAQKKSPDCSLDLRDYNAFVSGYTNVDTREWFENNVLIDSYLSFRVVVEFVQHFDLGGHNFYYYQDPTTEQWELVPWDLDGTFISVHRLSITDPITTRLIPKFPLEYANRFRYLWQTALHPARVSGILDEWSPYLLGMARADRDRWEKEPRETCPLSVERDQCGAGYSDFSDVVDAMKAWIRIRSDSALAPVQDSRLPAPPTNLRPLDGSESSQSVDLRCRPFVDPYGSQHVASHWLLIEEGGDWAFPRWELASEDALVAVAVPSESLALETTYLFRVRHRDSEGRWGLLSEPTAFHVRAPDLTPPAAPRDVRVRSGGPRSVELRWEADAASDVLAYRISRDGEPLALVTTETEPDVEEGNGGAPASYVVVDEGATAGTPHAYTVTAVSRAGVESAGVTVSIEDVPAPSFGGWTAPEGGWDYLYEAGLNDARYVPTYVLLGALDGQWVRSVQVDRWDGSRPGEGLPGGAAIDQLPESGERGGAVSVLSLEDPGRPDELPPPNNRALYFQRDLALDGAGDGSVLDEGITLAARWRIHPSPEDLDAPRGQTTDFGRGQISVAYSGAPNANFSLSLAGDAEAAALEYPGGSVPVEPFAFQSVWVTIHMEGGLHRMRLYQGGSEEPLIDELVRLPSRSVESSFLNYLALGLPRGRDSGALQVDFVAYRRGVFAPESADGPAARFTRGDVNSDGRAGIDDALAILSATFRRDESLVCLDAADVNDSGTVDVSDAISVLLSLFQGMPLPPPAPPVCGVDPTPDALSCASASCP